MDLVPQSNPTPVAVWSPHPLTSKGRELVYAYFEPGESILEYLDRVGLLERMGRQYFVLTVNGAKVPREMWKYVKPKTGTMINIFATVHGGDGKNPLAIVAMIALMVFAPELAVIIGGPGAGTAAALTTFGRILTAGITVLGGMAINKIFPPPRPDLSNANAQQSSPTYSVQGGSNRIRRHEPMPKIVGTHRILPDLGAQPYTEFEGEHQVLFQVFDLGYNADCTLSEFKIGQTSINEFEGVEIEVSGADGQLRLFPANVDVTAGAEITTDENAWIQRTSSPGTTSLGVEITGILFMMDIRGGIHKQHVVLELQARKVGTTTWIPVTVQSDSLPAEYSENTITEWDPSGEGQFVTRTELEVVNPQFSGPLDPGEIRIINATRTPFKRVYRFNVDLGQYEIRLRRKVSAEEFQNTIFFAGIGWVATVGLTPFVELQWFQLRSYQPDDADYTGRRRIGLKIRATNQLNGIVDQFNCIARGKTLAWNGSTWVLQETSNPAWWFLNAARGLIINGKRVWGGGLDDSKIDLEGIKTFGAWCDQQGLTVNFVFDQQQSVYNVLSMIALNGRGTPSWGTGKLGVIWDAPDLPITAHFGMNNIIAGTFEVHYVTEDLADVVEGEFINPDLDWQRDVVQCSVPGATSTLRVRRIQLPGRTSKQLAAEDTNLYAAANAFRNRKYIWQSDWEAMPCSRGDVVGLSHDLAALDYSGRFVEGGNTTTLTLPKAVPLFSTGAFILIIRPDGTTSSHPVQGGTGTSTTLTANPALGFNPWTDPNHPPYDYRWKYGPAATPGKKVKIESFKPVSERIVEVSAIDEVPAYYTSKSNPVTSLPPGQIFGEAPVLSNLQLTEDGIRSGTGYTVKVTATWNVIGRYSFADVAISVNGNPRIMVGRGITGVSYSFLVDDFIDLKVFVTGYSDLGRLGRSAKIEAEKTINFSGLKAPQDVESFTLSDKVFDWNETNDVDVVGFEIRFHIGDRRTWEDALPFHTGLITGAPWVTPSLPPGTATFMIRALDASGRYSDNSSLVIRGLGDSLVANVLEVIDQKALVWPGTIVNGTINGSNNIVADTTTLLYKTSDTDPIYTQDGDPFYSTDVFKELSYTTPIIVASAPLIGSTISLGHSLAGSPTYMEWALDGESPFYSANDSNLIYSGVDTDPFYTGTETYTPWLGPRVIQAGERYKFRARAAQGSVQGVFSGLVITIDAPDRVLQVEDLALSAGGTRVPVPVGYFTVIKNVQATLQSDGGTAVTLTIEDKDATAGPLVTARNSSGTGVAGTADFFLQGY